MRRGGRSATLTAPRLGYPFAVGQDTFSNASIYKILRQSCQKLSPQIADYHSSSVSAALLRRSRQQAANSFCPLLRVVVILFESIARLGEYGAEPLSPV